jgi:DNA-directed RNA polymerase subunit RPC12/RpoP
MFERSTHKVATFFYCRKLNTFVCTQSLRAEKTSALGELIAPHVPAIIRPGILCFLGPNGGMMESTETVVTTRYLDKPTGRRPAYYPDPAIHKPVKRYTIKACIDCGQEFERPAGWRKTVKCPDCGNPLLRNSKQVTPETVKAGMIPTRTKSIGPRGFVYLILAGGIYYKIGCAKNLARRAYYFELELPFDFEIIHFFQADNMYEAEKRLHLQFASKRIKGEWFNLDSQDVEEIKGNKG